MRFCSLFFKNLKNLLVSIDMFGTQINLQINKENEYHTTFGKLMSIGILTLIFYSFLSLVIDMIDRKNPNVIQNIQYQANPQQYELYQDSFLFYLMVADTAGVPIIQKTEQQIYHASFSTCSRTTEVDTSISSKCQNFTLKSCATIEINSLIQQKLNISKAKIDSSVCFDPKDWNSISLTLLGTPQSPIFNSLNFKIEKCNNVTSGGNCAPQEIIDKKLSQGYIGFFFSDSVLNQQQANNPFSLVAKLITTSFSSIQYKALTLLMRKSKLYDKENFFYYFENNAEYNALLFERQQEQVYNIQKSELIDIILYLDDIEVKYYRTYNNILDILGQMGGLLELLLFLAGMIVKPLNKLSCDLFLASKIFQFQNQNNLQKVYPQIQLLGLVDGFVSKTNLIELKKFFKLKAQEIKMFVHQYLFTYGQDRKIIQQGVESIYNQIDIIFIINKLIEIDKLKKILLNEDQQILFNYIHKPEIQLGMKEQLKATTIYQNCYETNKLSFEEEILQAFNSYIQIKENNEQKSKKVNQKIINLLDKDIKLIFDNNDKQKLQKETSILQIQQLNSINDLSLQENRVET